MSFKVVRNISGDVVAFGPNEEGYEPVIPDGGVLLIEEIQPPPPIPPVFFEELRQIEFTKFRVDREQFLNRLAGIGLAAQFNGQDAVLASVCAVRVGLLDLTTDAQVLAATDLHSLKLAMKTRYAAILSGVPSEVLNAFKQVDA